MNDCVAIILVNYNNYQETLACVETLKKIDDDHYFIVIVDNHSTNESLKVLNELESDEIHIIVSQYNKGFAYGNNIGIDWALKNGAEYFLLLNNDTLVNPDLLKGLREGFQSENVGMTTCRIMYYPDQQKVWYAGGDIDWYNIRADHHYINQTDYRNNGLEEVTFVSGCCMMISRQALDYVGFLPNDYFMYYEDMDYCVKMKKAGLKMIYNPSVFIYHCVSSSSGGEDSPFVIEWTNRSRRKFFKKYQNHLSIITSLYVMVKCEIRVIVKMILKSQRMDSFKAYRQSFKKY